MADTGYQHLADSRPIPIIGW